jgi:hypothetical protein
MTAIWPAGPPKVRSEMENQTLLAAFKANGCEGFAVFDTKRIYLLTQLVGNETDQSPAHVRPAIADIKSV